MGVDGGVTCCTSEAEIGPGGNTQKHKGNLRTSDSRNLRNSRNDKDPPIPMPKTNQKNNITI